MGHFTVSEYQAGLKLVDCDEAAETPPQADLGALQLPSNLASLSRAEPACEKREPVEHLQKTPCNQGVVTMESLALDWS